MQHFLKGHSAAARAWVVPAELLDQFLLAVDDPVSAFHGRFGRETLSGACSSVRKQLSSSKSFFLCMGHLLPGGPAHRSIVNRNVGVTARMVGRQAGSKRLQRIGQAIQGHDVMS
jgi:hypothetical protein